MQHTSRTYRAMARVAVPGVGALARLARRGPAHRAHLDAPAAIEAWARQHRGTAGPLFWFHAPSVGEGLQARAVIRALRRLRPEVRIIYTHYSPSAERFAVTVDAEWHGYLSYDRRDDVDRMLAAAQADLLVLDKLDVWPELVTRARQRGTAVALIAGTVSPRSRRLQWPSRDLTRPGYAALTLAAAIDQTSAALLARLGTDPSRIVVVGDPRIDSVLDVVAHAPVSVPSLAVRADRTLVAGSTWPADERVVLGAMVELRRTHPDAPLLIVPHEPTPAHVDGIVRRASALGLPAPQRLSTIDGAPTAPIVVVDSTGKLAELYRYGTLAYVGGGFGRRGIHSVLEPAAWGRQVIIGPNDRASPDAQLLTDAGALIRLPRRGSAQGLANVWRDAIDRDAENLARGDAARAALEQRRGAAERIAALLSVRC